MCKKCDALLIVIDKHILSVRKSDKTPEYEYGRQKSAVNRNRVIPPPGSRWLTPRELTDVLWLDCKKIMKTDEVTP